MTSRPPEHDEQTAKRLLRNYIFYDRAATEQIFVPHRIPPGVASAFIRREVKWDILLEHMKNAGNTARFYLLRDCVEHFASFFKERVRDQAEARRAAECIKVVGDLGDEGQQGQAGESFERLIKDRQLEGFADSMVRTVFHLGPAVSPHSLEKRLQELYQEHVKRLPDPESPDTPTNALSALIQPMLADAVAAKQAKERLLASPRGDARARGLARMYLGLDHSLYAQEWAGYALIAESKRSDEKTVIEGIRRAFKDLEGLKLDDHEAEVVAEYRNDGRARTVDAINYFGGELTAEERQFFERQNRPRNLFTPQEKTS